MVDAALTSIALLPLVCTGAAGQPVTGCNVAAISIDPGAGIVVPQGQFDVTTYDW